MKSGIIYAIPVTDTSLSARGCPLSGISICGCIWVAKVVAWEFIEEKTFTAVQTPTKGYLHATLSGIPGWSLIQHSMFQAKKPLFIKYATPKVQPPKPYSFSNYYNEKKTNGTFEKSRDNEYCCGSFFSMRTTSTSTTTGAANANPEFELLIPSHWLAKSPRNPHGTGELLGL
ncbi:hypothetical protein BT96DRAFT_969344 [Gymnopus androsaceus JB14]|uniref:Uncharacterized protein n=1 Tax=Gymnopus androsaceus JB14 TaxID=1447944 RepID=A0A6A4IPL8_9AGAR|nr:hypothetical protein BT96DRAFT_969344 [Gymnopus androsaceus JB14]